MRAALLLGLTLLVACGTDEAALGPPAADAGARVEDAAVADDAGHAPDAAAPDAAAPDAATPDAGTMPDAGATSAPACEGYTFRTGGRSRRYILCPPSPDVPGPRPVVLGFHGGGGNARNWFRTMPLHEDGQARGFVTVYMQGCRAGSAACGTATGSFVWDIDKPGAPEGADDIGYVRAVLDRLEAEHGLTVDRDRVYGTGHSMGGIFLYHAICDAPGLFRAIAPISSPPTDGTCAPTGDVDIFHVHGDADPNVPFDTGCCSAAQQTPGDPAALPGCAALPACFNPSNWWPPVRSDAHPFADTPGLDAIAAAVTGCAPTSTPSADRPLCTVGAGCRDGRRLEICRLPDIGHGLGDIEAAFGVRAYVVDRFGL